MTHSRALAYLRWFCIGILPIQMAHAQALQACTTQGQESIMIYTAQGVDHNLTSLPKAIFQGKIKWEDSHMEALSYSKKLGTLAAPSCPAGKISSSAPSYGYEIIAAQHRGLQSNAELGVAFKLYSSALKLGAVSVSAAGGVGLSHAFGRPTYEDGPSDQPERRYKTQLLILVDLEWRLQSLEHLALITRIHHRSGAYGLIAPRNVGSNFLALGLRYDF
jgi:hypothetical protein